MKQEKRAPQTPGAPSQKGQLRQFRRSPKAGAGQKPQYTGREHRERQRYHVLHTFVRFQKRLWCFSLTHFSDKFPIRNLHSRGISFRSLKPLKVGNKLLLNLETSVLVHAFPRKCRFSAHVVWVDKLPNKTYWRVGCKIMGKNGCRQIAELVRDGVLITKTHERDIL